MYIIRDNGSIVSAFAQLQPGVAEEWVDDNSSELMAFLALATGPLDQHLTKRQINAAMILGAGILDPDGAVTAAIGSMSDPVAAALALNEWRNAPYYRRDHDLFNDAGLMAAMNLTSEQIDGLWALGAQQPA